MTGIWRLVVWCVLLGITAGLTLAFNIVGFAVGVVLCLLQAGSFKRRDQNRQHKELMAAMRDRS